MASASRVDQATIAFRRVLAEANTGEQARIDALVVLAQRTVYVATWPGQQTARTLTNSHGESALPLFTGLDVLDVTATRFGWRNPDGTLQFRELGAREALRHALARSVHFVVIDLGSEHSVEFAREELEPLVNLQEKRSGTGAFPSNNDPQAALRDAVRRTSTRPPRTPLPASPPLMQSRTPAESQPIPTLRPPLAAKPRSSLPPLAAAPPPPAGAMPRPPSMHARPAKPVSGPRPVQREELPHSPPANRQREQLAGHLQREPPASLQHAAPAEAQDDAPQRDVHAPVAPPQRDTFAPQAKLQRDPHAAFAQPQREAHSLQGALERDPHAPAASPPAGPQRERPAPPPPPPSRLDEPTLAERTGTHPGIAPANLPDTVLHGISTGLRSFPEVEWACVMSDGSDIPLIGVRVDPSFLNRVADITDAIMDVGDKQALELQVLLLNNQELVKNARKNGKAFYPWKR